MKKMGAIFMLLALMALSGCGGQAQEASWDQEPAAAIQALADGGAFSEELEQLDGDTAFALYHLGDGGLERGDLTDSAVVRSAGATCEEGAVLVFADQDKAAKALEALKDYVQQQIDTNRDYRPQEIPKLENAILERSGAAVLLVVAGDLEAARGALG